MKSAIITGVGGFFGSHLCNYLLRHGIKVIGVDVDDKSNCLFGSSSLYTHIQASFEDYMFLHEKIDEEIDVFFHFAWAGGLQQNAFWNIDLQLANAKYACIAFQEASKIGVKRFVNSGTNNQIEIKQFLNATDYIPRGTTIYASAKMALELMCKTLATRSNTEFLGTMIPMPYGEGNKSMQLVNVVIKKLLEGESPSLIDGNNLYDMVYIDDIVKAFVAIAEKGVSGRSYYIGHRKLRTFRTWIESIRDLVAPSVKLKFGEYKDPLDMDYSFVDLDLLYNDTGFECESDFSTCMKRTVEWVKCNL